MPNADALRIVPDADRLLTKDQKRFNTLLAQIEQARGLLTAWQENILVYGQSHVQLLVPLEQRLREARRHWVFTLHGLIEGRGWTRAERETMKTLICDGAAGLLGADDDDAELKALFAKHADTDFDSERLQALQAMKDLTETMTGLDLGDHEEIASEEDLLRRLHRKMEQQAEAADAEREAKASTRRKTAAQQRREDEARLATQSVREVFRKLASALHPDRETDAAQREMKTALMQRANQAYARNDLLALLELQLQIEQVDAGHMANADPKRVKHYNKVLAEQLDEIRTEIEHVKMGFRADFGLAPDWESRPDRLGLLLQEQLRDLRVAQAQTQQETKLFADAAAVKRWLKVQRRLIAEDMAEMDFLARF